MFGKIGIHQKIIIGFAAGCIIPLIMLLALTTFQSKRNVALQTSSHLKAIRDLKKIQIENYFNQMSAQLRMLTSDPFVKKLCLQSDTKNTLFSETTEDASVSQRFLDILNYNQWDKILLVNPEYKPVVAFTRTKKAENIAEKIQDSHIRILEHLQKNKKIVFSDVSPSPDSGEPGWWMAGSVSDKDELLAYVMIRLSLKRINEIMHQRNGLGKTGQAYLVGQDKLRRSDDYFEPLNGSVKTGFANPAKAMVNNHAYNEALAGKTGAHFTRENKNKKQKSLFSAYTPVNVGDMRWALIIELPGKEAFLPVQHTMYMTMILALCAIMISTLIAFFLARMIKLQLDFQNELTSLPRKEQILRLETQMCEASEKLEFEKAAYFRDKIRLLKQGQLI